MSVLPLIPVPAGVELHQGSYPLDAASAVSGDLAGLLADELRLITGIEVPVAAAGSIRLSISGEGRPESYRVEVTAEGVRITGADRAGLRFGVWTLTQAVARSDQGWQIPALLIEDHPRFSYRGCMLDVARRYHDLDTITAVIDRAARLKLNVIHLHLSDDQAWRLAVECRPELTAAADTSAALGGRGGHYSRADYAAIVAHAASYDMTVVPEIDLPGHTHAIGVAYPDLAEEPVIDDGMLETIAAFGGSVPVKGQPCDSVAVGFSSLRIHHEPTYAFLAEVLGEVAEMTPGPWLHVGGDECLGTPADDFAYFVERVTALVTDLGKTPILWHEAGSAAGLAAGTVGQFWGFRDHSDEVAAKARRFPEVGGQLVLSPADAIYLDMKYDEADPLGLSWAGTVSVEQSYAWEPATLIDGVAESDILGVEAPTWCETLATLEDLDHMRFPRIASAAEIAWSPAPTQHPWRTWDSFRARLAGIAPLWLAQGIGFHRAPGIDWD